eukprot:TRINITY_DN4144_c0_g1_i1.p1 TRINITY_DN4144_c0_g1~~TRINITY_DN4144_c0_g1_i1.p1  ORF type:complete len:443 (+),score=61.04 TRINITY_DN4144_c0_g1_i1:137-1465(+)
MIGYRIINGGKMSKQNCKKKDQCEECGKQRVLVATALCTCGQQVCKACHKKKLSKGGCTICSLSCELKMKDIRVHEIEVEVAGSKKLLLSIYPPSDIESEDRDADADCDRLQDTDVETESMKQDRQKCQSRKQPRKQGFKFLSVISPRNECTSEVQDKSGERNFKQVCKEEFHDRKEQGSKENPEILPQNQTNQELKLQLHHYNYPEGYQGDRVITAPPKSYNNSPIQPVQNKSSQTSTKTDLFGFQSKLQQLGRRNLVDSAVKDRGEIYAELEKQFKEQDELDEYYEKTREFLSATLGLCLTRTCSSESDDLGFVSSDIGNLPFSLDESLSEQLPDDDNYNYRDDTNFFEDQNQEQQQQSHQQQISAQFQENALYQQNFEQEQTKQQNYNYHRVQSHELSGQKQTFFAQQQQQPSPTSIFHYQQQPFKLSIDFIDRQEESS